MRQAPLPLVQPHYPVELDRDHPLSRGLIGLWHFNNPAIAVNLADPGHYDAKPKDGNAQIEQRDQYRGAKVSNDTSSSYWDMGLLRSTDALRGAHTDVLTFYAFLYFQEGLHGNTFPRLVDVSNFGAGGSGYAIYAAEGTNEVKFAIDGNGNGFMSYNQSAWQHWGVEINSAEKKAYGWLNGAYKGSGITANSWDLAGAEIQGGFFNWMHSTDRQMRTPVPLIACWRRKLSDAEHLSMARSPFQVMVPRAQALDALGTFLFASEAVTVPLSASSLMAMVAAGAMTRAVTITGSGALSASAQGAISRSVTITGSASSAVAASGALSRDLSLGGATSVEFSASAPLVRSPALASAVSMALGSTGSLSASISLSGDAALAFAETGLLSVQGLSAVDLAGSASLGLYGSGDLARDLDLGGLASLTLDVGAAPNLQALQSLSGTATLTLGANADLARSLSLAGGAELSLSANGSFQIPVTVEVIEAGVDGALVLKMRTRAALKVGACASDALVLKVRARADLDLHGRAGSQIKIKA